MDVRLLCCSDTHGRCPPELDESGAAAWLHAGDLYDGEMPKRSAGLLRTWIAGRSIPFHCVRGNHDVVDNQELFTTSRDVTGMVIEIAPRLYVAGVGWCGGKFCDLPLETDLAAVCNQVLHQARRLRLSDRLVLLTHYPPYTEGLFPLQVLPQCGWVYGCVADLVEELKPVAVVQGHVHDWFGRQAVLRRADGSTLVVNPGTRGGVLDVDVEGGIATFAGR